MFRSDQVNSVDQIPLGDPISGHQSHASPARIAQARESSSTVASTASTSTAAAQEASNEQDDDNHSEDEQGNSSRSEKKSPDQAPKSEVNQAARAITVIPHASGIAAAPLQHSLGTHGREKDMGIEDKHSFFDSHLKKPRREVFKKVAIIFIGITLWLWICLSFFWGSTYKLTQGISSLNVRFVTFDTDPNALLNQPMTQQANYLSNLPDTTTHLTWEVRDASLYPNGLQSVQDEVLHQECWATVVVNANATSAWRIAIRTGNASYDPNGAIGIYYMGARFYQVQYLYTEKLILQELMTPLTTARRSALQAFNTYAQNTQGAIATAALAPQTLGPALGYTIFDLRPLQYWAQAGSAPMEASLIYFVIFAFIITFVGAQVRMKTGIEDRLTFRSKVMIRFCWPLLAYFFLSLWQTLIVRAFQIPLDDYLGKAGFVTLWALNYVMIIGAGLALETMLCIVGIPFLPVFLILWIIINITSSFYPIEMLPTFYNWLKWTPFLHNVEGFKIIAYGTNRVSRLGYHFGILFALIGVELICLPLAMVFERWSKDKAARKAKREEDEKKGDTA